MDSKALRVIYDATRLIERLGAPHLTGVDRVDLHYALWLEQHAKDFRWVVQTVQGFRRFDLTVSRVAELQSGEWEKLQSSKVRKWNSVKKSEWLALFEKFRRVGLIELVRERGPLAAMAWGLLVRRRKAVFPAGDWSGWTYVNIGHGFRFEAAMESIPAEMKRLYFLHDVIPLTHPETQKTTSRAHFRKFCEYVGHPMSDVIVSSHATVDAIATLPQSEEGLLETVSSIQVCPLAVEEGFRAERLEGLKEEELAGQSRNVTELRSHGGRGYFLSVGTVEPRKNLELLVRVWERLLESRDAIPRLIWVGKFGWSCDKQLMRRFERLQQQGHAELRSGVSDPELLELMAGAIALLFPSKIEGWGLPLSEALALRVPVIASRIAVFEEVGQGVPELLELDDLDAWKSMILNYAATDSSLRAKQIQRMQCYQPLAWAQHFEQLETLWGSLRP